MTFTVAQPPFQTNQEQEKKKEINSLFLHQNPSQWQRWGVTASAKVPSPPRSHRERSSDGWWPPRPPGGHNIAGEWQWCSGGFGYLLVWLMAAAVHPTRAQHVGWMGKNEMAVCVFFFFPFLSSLLRPAWMLFFITIIFLVILQRFGLSQRERSSHFVLWKIKGKGFIWIQTRRKVMHAVLMMLFSIFSLNLKGGICGGFIKVKN